MPKTYTIVLSPSEIIPWLDNLVATVRMNNPDVRIVWHMTWAYASCSTHPGFRNYGNDRKIMFESIEDALTNVVDIVDLVIPSGRLIESLRDSDRNTELDLTRDGYHLDCGFPCLALSCLWHDYLIKPVTGKSAIEGNEDFIEWLLSMIE